MTTSPDAGAFARLRAVVLARLRPYENWRCIVKHAWSFRLALIAALLSGAEVMFAVFTSDPPIERGTFAALSGLVTIAAALARLFAQTKLGDSE